MLKTTAIIAGAILLGSCTAGSKESTSAEAGSETATERRAAARPRFEADSAYAYTGRQVEFGPRVPNTEAHERAAAWLSGELRRHGAEVIEQKADLRAFDGTILKSTNIFGSFNPETADRLLLLAHYDTRPWADQDKDASNRRRAIDGANDGASGVGVLLEIARLISLHNPGKGIDILFSDSEDYGTDGDEDSWALGTRYFAEHPIKPGYRPGRAILLDMVGGKGAIFPAEYFSRKSAPQLDDAIRGAANRAGHGALFPQQMGGAVTDDHVELIKQGIPSVDIIDYRTGEGFCPTWHTMDDNMENIDKATLRGVGETLVELLWD